MLRYRWNAPHAIEGLCGPGHRLAKDGCATCGPTVRLSPSMAKPHIASGALVAVRAGEVAAKVDAGRADELLDDIERQSKANAALQAQLESAVEEVYKERVAYAVLAEELAAERARSARLEALLADQQPSAEPRPVAELLDELTNRELVDFAERVRVNQADDDVKAFTGRVERRARTYLDGVDPVVVRQLHGVR